MSASLVKKSLALVDDSNHIVPGKSKRGCKALPIPENQKVIRKVRHKGRAGKVNVLQSKKKLTVIEAKKTFKSNEQIFQNNLKKLKLIREAVTIELDDNITSQLIERAVTRRPIQTKHKQKLPEKSAFTEEDFKKFEEDYFDDDFRN